MMVNNFSNLSAYQGVPPSNQQTDRRIAGGPLYPKVEVQTLLDQGESILVPWTRKCKSDLQRLSWDRQDALILVQAALSGGRYHNSEWCQQQPSGPWAACDAYQLSRLEWIETAHKDMTIEYYVKFAIGKTRKLLLLVSCHQPQDRG